MLWRVRNSAAGH